MSPYLNGGRNRRGDGRSASPNEHTENDQNPTSETGQSPFSPLLPESRPGQGVAPNHPFDATLPNDGPGHNGELRTANSDAPLNGRTFDATRPNGELRPVHGDAPLNGHPFDATFSRDDQQDGSSGGVAQGQEHLVQRRFSGNDGALSRIEYYGQVQGQERLVQQWSFDEEGSVERIIVFNNQLPGPPAAHVWTFHPYEEFPDIQIHDNASNTLYDYRPYHDERVYQLHQLVFDRSFGDLIRQYYPHILASGEYADNREEITTQLHAQIRLATLQNEQGVFEDLMREHPILTHLSEYRVYQVNEQLFRITSHGRLGGTSQSHAFRHNGEEVEPEDIS